MAQSELAGCLLSDHKSALVTAHLLLTLLKTLLWRDPRLTWKGRRGLSQHSHHEGKKPYHIYQLMGKKDALGISHRIITYLKQHLLRGSKYVKLGENKP